MPEQLSMSSHGRAVSVLGSDLERLARTIRGDLLHPGHAEYEAARRIWNGLVDKRPALVVRCAAEEDVVAAVRFAHDHDIDLAVRAGGHNVAGTAVCDGGLVVDLSRMRGVSVDGRRRTVTCGGGALLGDVDAATQPHGLAVPLGLVSKTGVAGLTLHGGYGWLSRRFGLSSDNLVSARVVTASGQVLRASEQENPDLFWAIRGGGGNFGVVTSFELRAHEIGKAVSFALTLYPFDQTEAVLRFFRDFMAGAPDEITALGILWSAPPLPAVPAELHGAPVAIVAAVHSGPIEQGESALRPLRSIARPIADLSGPMPFTDVQRTFDEDYPDGRLYYWKSIYLPDLPDEAIRLEAALAAARPSPLTSLDVWGLGGAVSRVPEDATAFARRSARFMVGIESNWEDPARTQENVEWTRRVFRENERFARGETYLNFAGFGEGGEALVRSAYGANYERLREVKAKYDPDNLFHGNFNIEPRRA